jgi:two-component system nitrate/nitrite response regulator NarL
MDALRVFYRIRHDQGLFDALLTELPFVFASGCHFQAMAAVQAQCAYVMRHRGGRPTGREETGAMLGSVTTKTEALELCALHEPQILITYEQLEDSDGLNLVQEARERWPELKILLILQRTTLPRLRQALHAGSNGILADSLITKGYILTALRAVLRGDTYLDPSLGTLLETSEACYDPQINPKQLAIMALVMAGHSDRQIAEKLGMAFDTVRHQLKQVYRQLGINNRCQACLILLQLGLLRMPALPQIPRAGRECLSTLTLAPHRSAAGPAAAELAGRP